MNRLTATQFLDRAKQAHGPRYDYSLVLFRDTKTKVKIVCVEHGVFEQTPGNHMQGLGCLQCGFKNAGQYHKKNTESFVAAATANHGHTYDYSLAVYKGAREPIAIVCREHGAFEQTATVHLRGAGCEKCSYESRGKHSRMTFDQFVQQAENRHGNAYDYGVTKSDFIDSSTSVPIACRVHGLFNQAPANHIMGQGCPKCGRARAANSLTKNLDEFVRSSKLIHGETYDYAGVIYQGAFKKVRIVCALDGEFLQSPTSHLSGIGCPKCSRRNQGAPRNLTRALRGEFDGSHDAYVYIVAFKLPFITNPLYKVGSGTGNRIKSVQAAILGVRGYDLAVTVLNFPSRSESIVFEHLAHEQIRESRMIIPGEHKFAGYSEVFTRMPDLDAIQMHPTLLRFRLGERWNPQDEAAITGSQNAVPPTN